MGNSNSAKVENSFFGRLAYQVVHVVKDSPAEKAGLMPYFDFLTHIPPVRTFTNCPLPYDEFIRDAIGINEVGHASKNPKKVFELSVFSCASAKIRKVHLTPEKYNNARLDITGFLYRPVIISEAICSVEHVQEVSAGSPAFNAGLVPHFDYIIATDEGNCSDMHQIIQPHSAEQSNRLRIYVVDIFLKASRVVDVPGIKKLGERRFGCTLASGYLHRIPTNFPLTFHLICSTEAKFGSSRPVSRATSVEGKEVMRSGENGNNHHQQGYQDDHHHGHNHDYNHDHDHDPDYHHNGPDCKAKSTFKNSKNKKLSSKSLPSPLPPSEPLDPNSCLFVTRLRLSSETAKTLSESNGSQRGVYTLPKTKNESPDESMPISVQIPKEIVANVVAELVRYQKEHQETGLISNFSNGLQNITSKSETSSTNLISEQSNLEN